MPDANRCPECGTPLPSGALAGFCPACLLKQGALSETATDPKRPPFTPPSLADLAPLFPQLELLELIGKGGMGAVYKARQKQLDRIVALKILPPGIGQDAAFAERFAREARALARLNHPGIVTLFEFGQTAPASASHPSTLAPQAPLYFFLMEFVDGVNLRQLLTAGRMSPREALAIVPQICDALQFAHDQGIVHRDIKPENILIDRRGRVKVADFGLAKILAGKAGPETEAGASVTLSPASDLTEAGKVMGTPQYMSPEQFETPTAVDHRADIYALGVVFYQMLTGELPGKPLEPPSRKVQLDVRLDEVVLRALAKQPELRYQQASDVKTLVESIATTPAARSQESQPAPSKPVTKRLGKTVALPVAVALVGLAAWFLLRLSGYGSSSDNQAAKRAWSAPHPQPTRTRQLAGAPFVAQLPAGGSVELLAIHLHPSTNSPWWQPDGAPSSYDRAIVPEPEAALGNGVVGLVRMVWPKSYEQWPQAANSTNPPSVRLQPGLAFATQDGRRLLLDDLAIMPFEQVLPQANETTLTLQVATASWQPLTVQKPGLLGGALANPARKEWQLGETTDGFLKVTITHLSEDPNLEHRLVAVDVDGTRYTPSETRRTKTTIGRDSTVTLEANFGQVPGAGHSTSLPFKRVREVRWEARPYETVVFRHVSLKPGHQTKVEVLDFGGQEESVAAKSQSAQPPAQTNAVPQQARELAAAATLRPAMTAPSEGPVLRFLAWQDEWQTNQPFAAHHPDGSLVTDPTELGWLRAVVLGKQGSRVPEPGNPRFLNLWFSHPLFDRDSMNDIRLWDEYQQPIALGRFAKGCRLPAETNGNLGWLWHTVRAGEVTRLPERVTLRLSYSIGPLERLLEVSPSQGPVSSEEGYTIAALGQNAKTNAFVSIIMDSYKMPSRVVGALAVTREGRELHPLRWWPHVGEISSANTEQFEFGVPLADVAKFRIGTKALRTAEWKDVLLPPR